MKLVIENKEKNKSFDIELTKNKDNSYYAVCFDENQKEVGYITFKNLQNQNTVWLYRIYVDENSRGNGVGTALLYCLEAYCLENKKEGILAKFFPENEKTESFYVKHNFDFKTEGLNVILSKPINKINKVIVLSSVQNFDELNCENKQTFHKQNTAEPRF